MKKYKLLRFGRFYINRTGDFAVCPVAGNKKHGYTFLASHANPSAFLRQIYPMSRIVPNDGNWIEIRQQDAIAASACHDSGYGVEFPTNNDGKLPKMVKLY